MNNFGSFDMRVLSHPINEESQKFVRETLLNKDGSIIFPTETFYALGCAANRSVAVSQIYSLKKRSHKQPLLVLVNSWEMLNRYIEPPFPNHLTLLQKHWPGPLTAIFNQNGNLAKELNYQGSAVGFRMTSSSIASELIEIIGVPLVGTSANVSSQKEASDCQFARNTFGDAVDIYIDGGRTPGTLPSTLVDMTKERYTVVRKGLISI